MKNYFKAWNFMRTLRLALGVFLIIQGILAKEWMFVALGGIFSLMPLLNIGCCGTTACNNHTRKNMSTTEEISYEEIQ